jgi:membrane protein YdbS with pleckstrin-like domain
MRAMYERAKSFLLWLAKVPPEPLDPMGDVQSLRVFRAAPGYLHYIIVGWVVSQISLLIGVGIALASLVISRLAAGRVAILVMIVELLVVAFFLIQAAVTYFSLRLNYEMRWYKVTDRSLRIRTGVWNVHEMTVTFANVQNITITQGPLERLFGISDVKVETAGGGGAAADAKGHGTGVNLHLAVFRGVDNPEAIRSLILERLRRLRDAGLGDVDEAPDVESMPDERAVGFSAGPEMLDALAAFRDEARALRRAAEGAADA